MLLSDAMNIDASKNFQKKKKEIANAGKNSQGIIIIIIIIIVIYFKINCAHRSFSRFLNN